MTAYHYSALDRAGKTQKGTLEADSPREVRQQLRQRELSPLTVDPISTKFQSNNRTRLFSRKRLTLDDLALVTRQLATLLAAGLPIASALAAVIEQVEKPHIKTILLTVRSRVQEGYSFANSLRQVPQAFSELYCATVAAGEQSGHLDAVLIRLADHTEQQQTIRQKVQQALIYPSLMTIISLAIVIFLLVFVVPKIIGVFKTTGQALPETTMILIGISHFISRFGIYLLIFLLLLAIGFKYLLKQINFRHRFDAFLLRLPLIGYVIKTLNTARFARTFGILTAAGVEVLESIRVAASLVSNIPMHDSIKRASERVREGTAIHSALKATGYFSPMTIHLIASGETSGKLESMLQRAADTEDAAVTRLIATALTLFEPTIIIIMGTVVLFIVLAILLPIFQMDQFTG